MPLPTLPWAGLLFPKQMLQETAMLRAMNQELYEHQQRLEKLWKVYREGSDKPLRTRGDDVDDNVVVPFEQVIVDTGVDFLFGKGDLEFELEDAAPTSESDQPKGGSAAQEWLDKVWDKNRKKTLLTKFGTNGGVFGHAFIKIIPRVINGEQIPRLVNLDPMTVTTYWDQTDIEEVEGYVIEWNAVNPDTGRPEVHQQLIYVENENDAEDVPEFEVDAEEPERVWKIVDRVKRPDDLEWVILDEQDWDYSWPPIIDCQNLPLPNEYWGRSDIEEAIQDMVKTVSRIMSNCNRIVRFYGHPSLVAKGISAMQLLQTDEGAKGFSIAPDEVITLPNPEATIEGIQTNVDLTAAIELYKRVKELLHQVSKLPEVTTGKMENVGQLSGVALDILYGPIKERTEKKKCTYGDMLEELNMRLLELGGFGEDMKVNNVWPDIMPHDPAAEGQVLMQDKQLGVSNATLMRKRGYDPEIEAELHKQEAEANLELQQQAMEAGGGIAANPATKAQQDAQQAKTPEQQLAESNAQQAKGKQPAFGKKGKRPPFGKKA